MRGRGLILAFLFVIACVALAWATGDKGPWGGGGGGGGQDTKDASGESQP